MNIFLDYQELVFDKTGGFMGVGNLFRLKSYTRQNHYAKRVPCKKPYSIWMKNKKKGIQKVKYGDKLEAPCT